MTDILRTFIPSITRYCTQHREHAQVKGGAYQVSRDGMTRRWRCGACVAQADASAEIKKEARINGL